MNKPKRRDFLKGLGAAAIILPFGVKAITEESFEAALERMLAPLVTKFDRLSPVGKQQMIDSFDSAETIERVERVLNEPFDNNSLQVLKDIKGYFEDRLKNN